MTAQATQPRLVLTQRERELGAIISSYNDVTDRLKGAHERLCEEVTRLREELRQKNAELRRRERLAALGEMAAGLAHEIRNPLGGIALSASKLEKDLAPRPKSRAAAVRISQGVRSLEKLVSQILDFAQDYRLDRRPGRLGEVLSAVEDSVRPWAAEHGVTVSIEPSALAVEAFCDQYRLRQVLVNLVLNGIQSADRGGHVWVSAKPTDPAPDGEAAGTPGGIEIEVRDDGPGIPADRLDRIFNPFFTTRSEGTGLGLAIVHGIVEAHGGTIRADNCPASGARFVVRLPPESEDRECIDPLPVPALGSGDEGVSRDAKD